MRQNETRIWDVVVRDPQAGYRSAAAAPPEGAGSPLNLDVREVLNVARRNKRLIGGAAIAGAVTAVAIGFMLPKYFEATTRMLIDPRGLDVVDKRVTPGPATVEQGAAVVESEMHVLSSDSVLSQVIEKHRLTSDPEFNGTDGGPLAFITGTVAAVRAGLDAVMGVESQAPKPELVTLQALRESIFARREPTSYTVDIGVVSKDPQKSAAIANWITEEYLATRLNTRASATARAGNSLAGRLDQLRNELEDAESKVEAFKRQHDIFTASGQLVSEQQLSELNTQLVNARAETLRASARLEQIRSLASAGIGPDATLEALQSENIGRLRQQYAVVRQRQAALGSQLLPSHPSMQQVRQELSIAERQLKEELNRIEQTARLNLERATGNERRMEAQLRDLKQISSETNNRLVTLRELEREAEARRSVYSTFLLRSRELAEQQRVDSSMVTVISPAVPPRRHNGPPLVLLALAGLIGGLGLGAGAALLREAQDAKLRSAGQLARLTDGWTVVPLPAEAGGFPARNTRNSKIAAELTGLAGQIRFEIGANCGAAVLVTSADGDADAGAAKTAISANLAAAAAAAGDRVLLIDADGSTAGLSSTLGFVDRPGLVEVAGGERTLGETLITEAFGSVNVLAHGNHGAASSLDTQQIRKVIDTAENFDLIVLDGGALLRDRSLRGLISVASHIVVVTREGGSDKAQLATAFQALQKWHVGKGSAVILADA